MPRTFVMVAALLTFSVLSYSPLLAEQASPSGGPPSSAARRPMPKPVNLKVLSKDISPEDLMKVMQGFTQQLGVQCTFCHSWDAAAKRPNFASDEKPEKDTARTMMLMTTEINAKYLSQIHDPDGVAGAEDGKLWHLSSSGQSMPAVFEPKPRAMASKP